MLVVVSKLVEGAQEENLYRRTDMLRFLRNLIPRYPIGPYSAIVSRLVTVFRGTEEEGYPRGHAVLEG